MTKVFLDANVLYSNTTRSHFIWLHINRAVDVFWSMEVWEEAFNAYARTHDPNVAAKFRSSMTRNAITGYPACMINTPTSFVPIGLKDPNDEHVVAAATACDADYLVTSDADLLAEDLSKFDLIQIKPDDFMITVLTKATPLLAVQSVRDHMANLIKTKPSISSHLRCFATQG